MTWSQRMNLAIEYIESNLDSALNIEDVAKEACCSKYHFHRMFFAKLGYKATEMVGENTPAKFHLNSEIAKRADELTEELGQSVTPGFDVFTAKARLDQPDIHRWTYVHKDGSKIQVKLNISGLFNNKNQIVGFLGIAYDLSAQLRHEQALADALKRAEKANEAKSTFLANMSHEIRTPMNGVYGTLQILQQEIDSEQGKTLLDKAKYSVKSLTAIINDILDYSKIEAGKLTLEECEFSLSELLEYLHSELKMMIGTKGIEFSINNMVEHDVWIGDPGRVRQILLNIATNAVKFTPSGRVNISIKYDQTIGALSFEIADTGLGMEQHMLNRLFQRFEQADSSTTRQFGGTGLGLSITNSIVSLMQGKIRVSSTKGVGSTFVVTIPLAKGTSVSNQTDTNTSKISLIDKTILVAEDNDINRTIVEAMLSPTNASLVFAENGVEAVKLAGATSPDLILMDIQMPEMDGVEACKLIKHSFPSLPIIALTANAMTEDIKRYNESGFDGYLVKPVELSLLLSIVKNMLELESKEISGDKN